MTKMFSALAALAIAAPVLANEAEVRLPLDTDNYQYSIVQQQGGKTVLQGVKKKVGAQELQQLLPQHATPEARANAVGVPVGGWVTRTPLETYYETVLTEDMRSRCKDTSVRFNYPLSQVIGYPGAWTCYGLQGVQPVPVTPVIPVFPYRR